MSWHYATCDKCRCTVRVFDNGGCICQSCETEHEITPQQVLSLRDGEEIERLKQQLAQRDEMDKACLARGTTGEGPPNRYLSTVEMLMDQLRKQRDELSEQSEREHAAWEGVRSGVVPPPQRIRELGGRFSWCCYPNNNPPETRYADPVAAVLAAMAKEVGDGVHD
jgi:hypothetical protein